MKRSFEIAAFSIPVVYTNEGDHDPNGMVFAPSAVLPLLKWCKAQWFATSTNNLSPESGPQTLPRLHHRRQRAQLVIDGLERLEAMIARLQEGTTQDRALLRQMIERELGSDSDECHHYLSDPHHEHDSHRRYHASDRDRAVRMNLERVVTELTIALTDLQRPNGLPKWNVTDAAYDPPTNRQGASAIADVADPLNEPRIRLVSLTTRQREQLIAHWVVQADIIESAIRSWFKANDTTSANAQLKVATLASGMPVQWRDRLIFNDYEPGTKTGRFNRYNPVKPLPLLRPLVLRACVGDTVEITLHNELSSGRGTAGSGRHVGLFVQGHVMNGGPLHADGSYIGDNKDSRCPPKQRRKVTFKVDAEGVWPINDLADLRGNEDGTNVHGLFGALIVEPNGTRWLDPESGEDLTDLAWANMMDVILAPKAPTKNPPAYLDYETDLKNKTKRFYREFTVFIHDEPEIHSGLHTVGDHSLMPLSYRASPMHNRYPHKMRELVHASVDRALPQSGEIDLRAFDWRLSEELDEYFVTARNSDGDFLENVAGEEQHHSSWLFGDPETHIQRAYAGDPCRVRLVHAGVKETHVYHLHVHEWHAVPTHTTKPSSHGERAYSQNNGAPKDRGSHLLDSITISPQTGMTIDPLFGSGSRQHAIGDIIWHCHLYPHFHHGMWGLWRSYDRLVDGTRLYPDGSYCPPLQALPDRQIPPSEAATPGFPWFIDGVYPAKAPPTPAARTDQRNGRRILLGMPNASTLEREAMAPGCRDGDTPGALFVDLDKFAAEWNKDANLPSPRKISYDIEVRHDRIDYNVDGWFDPRGHHYRLMRAQIHELDSNGVYQVTRTEEFPHDLDANPEPCFPRANHGDIVEWRQHNILPAFNADQYDFGQLPVECGLHVHLVKFDVLAADGSSTGWNYLSGASSPGAVGENRPGEIKNVSLHRWVVDEEFGPCFFHDHLLANFRQKRGLFSALMVQPHGSQWLCQDNQSNTAWHKQQAVIVPPPESNLPPYREACLAVADYVPMLDRHHKALNPPSVLSGMSDPGVMGVNYRCAPMHHRGKDPSVWFSSMGRETENFAGDKGDPDTPIIRSYPGERLRIRLIQGSHEEQHSFVAHGLRWRRDWGHPEATLVNQQTLGISEAFTLDINPKDASAYGVGDHLWHFGTLDDIWLGNWGLVRVLPPISNYTAKFAPLPSLTIGPEKAQQQMLDAAKPLSPPKEKRTYVVVAQRQEHHYVGSLLTDPWGLIYRVVPCTDQQVKVAIDEELQSEAEGQTLIPEDRGFRKLLKGLPSAKTMTPLVLRALAGEWVRIILINDILEPDDDDRNRRLIGLQRLRVEPAPARLPAEHLDWQGHPDRRTLSTRVSLHASLLRYNVSSSDGSFVGLNPDSTVAARRQRGDAHGMHAGNFGPVLGSETVSRAHHSGTRNWREYLWWADPQLAPSTASDGGMGQACYLHDLADIRNHRHHGLIGALVVLPRDVRPFAPGSTANRADGWSSFSADIRKADDNSLIAREAFWFMQDGLRFFVHGSRHAPMPDAEPGLDPVDCGQKAVNYRSYPVHHGKIARGSEPLLPEPILTVQKGDTVWLRVLGANDKPRQQGIVVHGAKLQQAHWMGKDSPMVGALSGIAPCRVENFSFVVTGEGDHAVRPGSFLWATQQGMWAQFRSK